MPVSGFDFDASTGRSPSLQPIVAPAIIEPASASLISCHVVDCHCCMVLSLVSRLEEARSKVETEVDDPFRLDEISSIRRSLFVLGRRDVQLNQSNINWTIPKKRGLHQAGIRASRFDRSNCSDGNAGDAERTETRATSARVACVRPRALQTCRRRGGESGTFAPNGCGPPVRDTQDTDVATKDVRLYSGEGPRVVFPRFRLVVYGVPER